MQVELLFLVIASVFFAFSLISKRIESTALTAPIIFVFAGLIFGFSFEGMRHVNLSTGGLHILAEFTLVLVLASDASKVSWPALQKMAAIPLRLLLIALPLIILTGTLIGKLVFPGMAWAQLALIAAILAPTDAALGRAVFTNEAVPLRFRQGLNVESGLNDGITLPAVLFFAFLLNPAHVSAQDNWPLFIALQLGLAPLVGIAVGGVGGWLIGLSARRKWITADFQGVAAIALAVLAYVLSDYAGGNGFIATYFAGLTYGNLKIRYSDFLYDFTETESQFLSYLTFFLFGAAILPEILYNLDGRAVLYAALSLSLIRMLPVMVSMVGLKLRWAEVGFLGWFGARGLASILFTLLVLEGMLPQQIEEVQQVVAITVLMSVICHGLSASYLGTLFGRWSARHPAPNSDDQIS